MPDTAASPRTVGVDAGGTEQRDEGPLDLLPTHVASLPQGPGGMRRILTASFPISENAGAAARPPSMGTALSRMTAMTSLGAEAGNMPDEGSDMARVADAFLEAPRSPGFARDVVAGDLGRDSGPFSYHRSQHVADRSGDIGGYHAPPPSLGGTVDVSLGVDPSGHQTRLDHDAVVGDDRERLCDLKRRDR